MYAARNAGSAAAFRAQESLSGLQSMPLAERAEAAPYQGRQRTSRWTQRPMGLSSPTSASPLLCATSEELAALLSLYSLECLPSANGDQCSGGFSFCGQCCNVCPTSFTSMEWLRHDQPHQMGISMLC